MYCLIHPKVPATILATTPFARSVQISTEWRKLVTSWYSEKVLTVQFCEKASGTAKGPMDHTLWDLLIQVKNTP